MGGVYFHQRLLRSPPDPLGVVVAMARRNSTDLLLMQVRKLFARAATALEQKIFNSGPRCCAPQRNCRCAASAALHFFFLCMAAMRLKFLWLRDKYSSIGRPQWQKNVPALQPLWKSYFVSRARCNLWPYEWMGEEHEPGVVIKRIRHHLGTYADLPHGWTLEYKRTLRPPAH